jgi:hypothetical protein
VTLIKELENDFKKKVAKIQEESELNFNMVESLKNSDGEYTDNYEKF